MEVLGHCALRKAKRKRKVGRKKGRKENAVVGKEKQNKPKTK
jgi:hypothetical protein